MKKSRQFHVLVQHVLLLLAATACSLDVGAPTGLNSPLATPRSPAPQPPAPSLADVFVWTNENGFTILPNPPGVILVSARAINDGGEVAGTAIMSSGSGGPLNRAFKWSQAGGFTFLPGTASTDSYAVGLDDDGNVVGYTEANTGAGTVRNAVIWNDSYGLRSLNIQLPFLHSLGIREGWIFGTAEGHRTIPYRMGIASGNYVSLQALNEVGGGVLNVNRRGEAVGYDGYFDYGFGGFSDAVIWDEQGARTVALSCHDVWNCFASLKAINANGIAVGLVTTDASDDQSPIRRAFRWSRDKGVEYLDDPSGATDGIDVAGVNDDGSILAFNRQIGFIINQHGSTTFIRPPGGYRGVEPHAMNRRGEVVGMVWH